MNNPILLDTNIVSFAFKGDTRIQDYLPHLAGQKLLISIVTVAELRLWTLAHQWQTKRIQTLETYLRETYTPINLNDEICTQWAHIQAHTRRMGKPMNANDCWIAATAVQYKLPFITHNTKDFAQIAHLRLITPSH
jgi:tRNA(fMet)-specific endonuclease VapC